MKKNHNKTKKIVILVKIERNDEMIQSIINGIQTLTSNTSSLVFDDNLRTRGTCWLCRQDNSPLFKITECGIYEITFNGNVSSATAGTTALGLYVDGVLIPATVSIEEIFTAGDYSNLGFTYLVKVCPNGNANISVGAVPSVLTGTTPTPTATEIPIIQNATLTIKRKA